MPSRGPNADKAKRLVKLTATQSYGAWNGAEIAQFLSSAQMPVRLSFTSRNGPIIVPLWFAYRSDRLICCSPADSTLVTSLMADPQVAFDISTNDLPYRGVRGRGRAQCVTASDNAQLEELLTRYLGNAEGQLAKWLLNRTGPEAVITVVPEWLTSWDFSDRMRDLNSIAERSPDSAL
jgi:nitroimidazol reductase NimA-like FMN-containing flavoprotein (pyridoxamine 5'-phosphate oxidase superfamily)